MRNWDDFYRSYADKAEPEEELFSLVQILREMGVVDILDAGCGTGRNSIYLAKQDFKVHAIDISRKAIQIARRNSFGHGIEYHIGRLSQIPFPNNSMDFIVANHSLEYGTEEDILKSVRQFDRVLKDGKPIFIKVDSKEYNYDTSQTNLENLAHVLFCINNGIPLHSFSEDELRRLFNNYDLRTLEHRRVEETERDYIREFILFGLKRYRKWNDKHDRRN